MPVKKKTAVKAKPATPDNTDYFEKWALESGFWIKVNWQTQSNPNYEYHSQDRVKIDFEDWKKKKYPKFKK